MKNGIKVNRCGLCKKPIEIEGLGLEKNFVGTVLNYIPFTAPSVKKLTNKVAVAWDTFGFSVNGWGRREDLLNSKFNDEICEECFDAIKKPIEEFRSVIKKRKNANAKIEIDFSLNKK